MPQRVYTGLGSLIYVRAVCDITEMKYLYCLDNGIVCAHHFSPHLRAAVRRCCVLLRRFPPPLWRWFLSARYLFSLIRVHDCTYSSFQAQRNAAITPHPPLQLMCYTSISSKCNRRGISLNSEGDIYSIPSNLKQNAT